jgi:hypothetical protein
MFSHPIVTWVVLLGQSLVIGITQDLFWISLIALLFGWLGNLGLFIAALPSSTIYNFFWHGVLRRKAAAAAQDSQDEDTYKDKRVGMLPIGSMNSPPPHALGLLGTIHPRQNQLAVVLLCTILMSAGFICT